MGRVNFPKRDGSWAGELKQPRKPGPTTILGGGLHGEVQARKLHEVDGHQQETSHASPPWWSFPQEWKLWGVPQRFMLPTLALEFTILIVKLNHGAGFRAASGESLEVGAAAENVAFMEEDPSCRGRGTEEHPQHGRMPICSKTPVGELMKHGTDPVDETPDSAAAKGAIGLALQKRAIGTEFWGESKNKYKG
ncbi:hypothetical protein Efla_001379 [Eimeria flavescens]